MTVRDIYLKIETIEHYSPVKPHDKPAPPIQYCRDCMRNVGHQNGMIPDAEVLARSLKAVVYREYEDPNYLIPKPDKLVDADINEPPFDHRVPGTVIYTQPGERLRIHVLNCDMMPHSFHLHGLEYGISSDGAWPFGLEADDGRRSDEICSQQSWTYIFDVKDDMIGVWPFHDHAQHPAPSIDRGLFGGIIVLPRRIKPPVFPFKLPRIVLKAKELSIQCHARREPIARADLVFIQGAVEFLREWIENQIVKPRMPRGTLHVPAFFHRMASAAAKPAFDSGDLEEHVGVFEHVFGAEGTFPYFCSIHPMMKGTVEVKLGAPATVTVNITDGPPMGFYPGTVEVGVGGTVRWENHSNQHHTVTSLSDSSMPSHCINGRAFVGNSPTIVAEAGQSIRWYVFNLDLGHEWHNFHPHAQRWKFANENIDVRSMSPAESFMAETKAPPVLLFDEAMEKLQQDRQRKKKAKLFHLKGDYVFHCHVHHHLMNGMVGLVRSKQDVWLTKKMADEIAEERGLPIDDGSNACPKVDIHRCKKQGGGEWQEVPGEPEVTFMHSMPLPNTEKVLYWGYTRADQSRLWDGPTGVYSAPANQPADLPGHNANTSDLWSAEHTFLDTPEGLLLANGGFTPDKAFLFDPSTETWSETGGTVENRFYSTTLTLADGRAMTLYGPTANNFEIYDPVAGTWSAPVALPSPDFDHHQYYPWSYVLPDGRIFIAGPHVPTQRFDPNNLAVFDSFPTIAGNRSTGGQRGTSALLTLRPPNYKPCVIIAGGNPAPAQQSSEIIDLSQAIPAWQNLATLNIPRAQQVNCALLPDGRVFLAGGTSGLPDGGPAEIYDPQDHAAGWKLGPTMKYVRGYHSSMVMLLDGTVLFGGDPPGPGGLTPHERFFPWYYFVPRPEITNAPASVGYGAPIAIDTPQSGSINEVILMRPGATTHGFNMSQRAIECEITAAGGGTVTAQSPPNGNVAAPGYYMLFILDGSRIPSVGRWIRLTP